jgi:transcriptional regulator with XRE-family HTH domain
MTTQKERIDKFSALVSEETSDFEKKALWRKANREWLKKSGAIAIKVLAAIKKQDSSQKELAEKMEVSAQYINKIVKGNENLSLETISKLETALGIQLIEVAGLSASAAENIPATIQTEEKASSQICKVIPLAPDTFYVQSSLPCDEIKTA